MYLARTVALGVDGPELRIIATEDPDAGWVDIRSAGSVLMQRTGATREGATRVAAATAPASLTEALAAGEAFHDMVRAVLADDTGSSERVLEPRFACPVDPPSYRDYMAFEKHFQFGYQWRGIPVPDVMYELPVAYLGNPQSFIGHDEMVRWPGYADEMDYELELGVVLRRVTSDVEPSNAMDHVLGFTLLNDFSARDIQRREMAGGLGPCKGKNFGTSVGPWIVTVDDFDLDNTELSALVNGEVRGRCPVGEMIWSVPELVSWASTGEVLGQGSLLASGTANGCSGVEAGILLEPGDTVTLQAAGLGILTNTIGPRTQGWMPAARGRG